jgi:hypothetical protein
LWEAERGRVTEAKAATVKAEKAEERYVVTEKVSAYSI